MLVFPDRVLHGAIPNKDFLYLYGPGSLWVLAGVYKVFGTHLVVERLAGFAPAGRHGARRRACSCVGGAGRSRSRPSLLNVMFVMPALQLIAIPWTGGAALALGALVALLQALMTTAGATTEGDGHDVDPAAGGRWALIGRRARRLRDAVSDRSRARARARRAARDLGVVAPDSSSGR